MQESTNEQINQNIHPHSLTHKKKIEPVVTRIHIPERQPTQSSLALFGTNHQDKRLPIFKDYEPRGRENQSQDEETVVYNLRKNTISSMDNLQIPQPKGETYFEDQKKFRQQPTRKDKDSQKTNRRYQIFTIDQQPKQNHNNSNILSKTGSQKSLIPTIRMRQNMGSEANSPLLFPQARESLYVRRPPVSPIKFSYSLPKVHMNTENKEISKHPFINLNFVKPAPQPSPSNSTKKSPHKITFTYQTYQGQSRRAYQLEQPKALEERFNEQRIIKKSLTHNIRIQPPATHAFESGCKSTIQQTTSNNPTVIKAKKSIFLNSNISKQSKTPGSSWGSKIRTELMGLQKQDQFKLNRAPQPKLSLINLKESRIVGEKIDRNNLKINESFSNVSDDQSSKRYFDEENNFLPPFKNISYNNIDVSREDSFRQNEDYFNEKSFQHHQLDEAQTLKCSKMEKMTTLSEIKEIKASVPILAQLHETNQPTLTKFKFNDKMLPMLLIVLASMLLLIQLAG